MTRIRPAAALLIGALSAASISGQIKEISVPGHPFSAIASADGQCLFVTLISNERSGIAVFRKSGTTYGMAHFVPIPGKPTEIVLTHDGKQAIVAAQTSVIFLDSSRLISGEKAAVVGSLTTGERSESINVNVTEDDKFLFVAEEAAKKITVVNLSRAQAGGFTSDAIVGAIPVGVAPIALTFSHDGRYLYTTSQRVSAEIGWPIECAPEGKQGGDTPKFPQGAVMVVDVAKAEKKPAESVISAAPAGCNPVRLKLSPQGDLAFVTARKDNKLLVLDTAKILNDPKNARLGSIAAGTSPVGLAIDPDGRKVLVASSNRFSGKASDRQFVSVIDVSRAREGKMINIGSIPAGAFPRELSFTPDQQTLIVTNFASKTVEFVDLKNVKLEQAADK